jgi:DNA-binding transcriptional ArsR family regulator
MQIGVMGQGSTRIRRLLDDELNGCCDGEVAARRAELETLERAIPADATADRAALGALGDETRYRIVRLLAAADDGELCVCELNVLLSVSHSAVSHALADLADAGLVARRKSGTWRYYRLTDRATAIVETLDETREAAGSLTADQEVDA